MPLAPDQRELGHAKPHCGACWHHGGVAELHKLAFSDSSASGHCANGVHTNSLLASSNLA